MSVDDLRRERLASDAHLIEEDVTDLYEHAPCGYLSTLGDGVIVKVNQTFVDLCGYGREDLLSGRRWLDLVSVAGRIFYETHFAPLLGMQGSVREIAFDLMHRDGRTVPVLVNATRRESTTPGRPAVIRYTIFDATDRRKYERELLRARNEAEREAKARADLIAMLSHDIRTPLNAIVMATALLEANNPVPAQAPFIKVLRSSTANAIALVNNVLDLSRLDAGRAVLRERPFDIRELVREVMSGINLLASRKPAITVNVTVDETIPRSLIGDVGKLAQVLSNLVTNAIKFTHEGFVSLMVALREVDDQYATLDVAVSDTGIGIPPDRLAHIFEEFTQASDDIAEKYGGSGLGLSITRKLLLLYDAQLDVSSTVGQGTTFSFALKLRLPESTLSP